MKPTKPILVKLSELKAHPENYREHPEDQLNHLIQSLKDHGCYRNIVLANDKTILAGHGIVLAARKMGLESLPAIVLEIGPQDPRALKLLVADNELGHLAMGDDRKLSELLAQLKDYDGGLLGTGYDESMLANLLFVTRPETEIKGQADAAEWAGMPEYDSSGVTPFRAVVSFRSEEDRQKFLAQNGIKKVYPKKSVVSFWWPEKQEDDASSVRFTTGAPNA